NREFVIQAFERLQRGYCGRAEDRSEDLFVGNVHTPKGNFKILGGIRESPTFCLQSSLDVIQTMPGREPFDGIRRSVEALLRLSDAVITRAKLTENCLGQEFPSETLPREIADRFVDWQPLVRFLESELNEVGVALPALSEFCFYPSDHLLDEQSYLGNSALE